MSNILTIAGTDPTGAAGITSDLQVFRDFGLHGLSVISAVVWQNTREVLGFRALEPDEVMQQWRALVDDGIEISAIKIGMLPSAEIAALVAEILSEFQGPSVLDPVLRSGSGEVELSELTSLGHLIKLVDVVTPNLPEARAWVGEDLKIPQLAERWLAMGAKGVLLKSGHATVENKDMIQDYWAGESQGWLTPLPRISQDVRGTGCQLSSALAAGLALGREPRAAAEDARLYLSKCLQKAERIGDGRPLVLRTK